MSPLDAPSFEQALAELERILRGLEDGSASLEESLSQYERGVTLVKHCFGQLRHAEQRILQLSAGDGDPLLTPFEHTAAVRQSPKRTASPRKPPPDDGQPLF